MQYFATFTGRMKGAIGAFEQFACVPVEAPDEQAARLKLYDTHQDISELRFSQRHLHRWKFYDGALGYESYKCEICDVDQADLRNSLTLEDLTQFPAVTITPAASAVKPLPPSLPDEVLTPLQACRLAAAYLQTHCAGTSENLLQVERALTDAIRAASIPFPRTPRTGPHASDSVTTRYRAFTAKYRGPGNVKGSRVVIHDLRHDKRRYIQFPDHHNHALDAATEYLESIGITVDALGLSNLDKDIVLLSLDMATPLK